MSTPPSATGAAANNEERGGWWARSGLVTRIVMSAALVGLGLTVVFLILSLAITGLRQRSLEARRSQQVIASANQLQTLVVDLETGVRGFAITHQRRYLAPWTRAQKSYPDAIKQLLALTADNSMQHERALAIQRSINDYLKNYSQPLVSFMLRNPNLVGPIVQVFVRRAATQTEAIRGQFNTFITTEAALGNTRDKAAHTTAERALIVGGIGLGAALLLILLGALYVNRAVVAPVRSAADTAEQIAGGDFSGRLRTDGPGEVGRLERTFNSMAASLERTLADLEERNRTLLESEQTKSELVSNVSHELRTPLASVLGFSSLMLDRELPPEEMRRYLEVIRTEARRLAELLNDLLDIQRIEQGTIELKLEETDLNDLLEAQVMLYSAQSANHDLHLDPADDDLVVYGDRDRLAQVIGNLLSNAIKYSPEGGVVDVSASLVGDEAWIWVRDEGLGIPTDHQQRIFTKFFRGDVGRERGISGTGLGLVLSRQIGSDGGRRRPSGDPRRSVSSPRRPGGPLRDVARRRSARRRAAASSRPRSRAHARRRLRRATATPTMRDRTCRRRGARQPGCSRADACAATGTRETG
jgi:signal transduction histidine kinase